MTVLEANHRIQELKQHEEELLKIEDLCFKHQQDGLIHAIENHANLTEGFCKTIQYALRVTKLEIEYLENASIQLQKNHIIT